MYTKLLKKYFIYYNKYWHGSTELLIILEVTIARVLPRSQGIMHVHAIC
jgi:hypothetical protein